MKTNSKMLPKAGIKKPKKDLVLPVGEFLLPMMMGGHYNCHLVRDNIFSQILQSNLTMGQSKFKYD